MATAKSKEKKQRRERLQNEKANRRKLKKQRQTKTLIVISCIVGAVVLGLAIFFCGRGILRSFHEKENAQSGTVDVFDAFQESPKALAGYWWYNEGSFFCIEGDEYRSYSLSDDGSAFYLSSEFTAAVVGDALLLYEKEGDGSPTLIKYTIEDDGKQLQLQYTTLSGESYRPSFRLGDPPSLPMLRGSEG